MINGNYSNEVHLREDGTRWVCIVHATFPSHVDAHIFADEVVKRLAGKDYAMPLPDPAGPQALYARLECPALVGVVEGR